MITCEPYRAKIPESTCIARQKVIHKKKNGQGWGNNGAYHIQCQACEDCQTGLALYQKHLKGETEMVHQNAMRECATCGKHHPPTEEFFARKGRGLSKVCLVCENREPATPVSKPTEPKHNEPVMVRCCICKEKKPLTADFFQRNKSNVSGFDGACKDCRNDQKRERREARKMSMEFDQARAEEIAREKAKDAVKMIAVFVDDSRTLDQIRAVAIQVAVESQRALVEAA